MHCCTFAAQCRQSRSGHQCRAVRGCGEGRIGERTAANGNKPISSLSDAGEPLQNSPFVSRVGRVSATVTGWRPEGNLPSDRLRELRGVSIHPEK
jgi:hypothetical protein